MPSRTSPRFAPDRPASGPSKLRASVPAPAPEPDYEDDDMDSDVDENNAELARYAPRHLDEPWAYAFQVNIFFPSVAPLASSLSRRLPRF